MVGKPAYYVAVPATISDGGGGPNYAVNGRLNPALLVQARGGGYGHIRAVPPFEAMKTAFDTDPAFAGRGYQLSYTGIYRTYDRQVQMLLERYTTNRIATTDTNFWQGKTWYLKPGNAMAATPGTSNHGWGLAWDLALRLETGGMIALTGAAVAWLRAHAGWFGFYNEVSSENWHYTYVWGDLVPPYLRDQPPPPPPPPPPVGGRYKGDDMAVAVSSVDGDPTQRAMIFAWQPGVGLGWITSDAQKSVGRITGTLIFDGSTGDPVRLFTVAELQDMINRYWAGGPVPPGFSQPPTDT